MKKNMWNHPFLQKSAFVFLASASLLLTACGADVKAQSSYKKAGISAMDQGHYKEAVSDFNKALKKSGTRITSEVIDINYYKACAQTLAGQNKDSMKTYTSIIDYKESADAYYLRAAAYLKEGDTTKAMADFQKSLSLDKSDSERYLRIYHCLANAGHEKEADSFLDLLLDLPDKDKEVLQAKGQAMEIRKDYKNAIRYYKRALDKDLPEARIDLARAYLASNEKEKAEAEIASYQKSEKETAKSLNAIGELQMTEEKYGDALKSFQKGLKMKDSEMDRALRKNEIIALEYTGDFHKAKKQCESFIKDYPEDPDMTREYQFLETR
ncbi:MAG: tetratricopeptide repeat protein [Lachnospiraceae bacterium]|nr:tetratricopeptide repeat protein [Lachnospiraceae bacterium]